MLAADHEAIDEAQFCAFSVLVLRERKSGTIFRLNCHHLDMGMILGRSISTELTPNYLDTTPLEGEELGVSRLHTYLCYDPESQAVLVTDLDSMNGTFINDKRVSENEVRVLRHGDRLRLGKLEFGVTILHALTTLEIE